jgi:hypothetical protein
LPHKPVHPTPLRNTRVSRSRVSAAIFIRLAYISRTDLAAVPSFARSENATQACNFRGDDRLCVSLPSSKSEKSVTKSATQKSSHKD